ncbi:MAG: SDR family oxidoreductase, partial [Bacteroidales bacterium]|nr:SDR family oxidoreductase [Bacteroidales bacterium]
MQNKVVVITGASSGIGKALAEKYASEGCKLALAARRLERLLVIEKQFPTVEILSVKTDVTKESDCKNLIDRTIEKFGRIDILINNAGISMRAVLENLDLQVIRKVMDVNFWGTVYCTKYALPWLLKSKGSLVGVISVGGYVGLPGRSGYSASKFAMRGFLDSVRIENRRSGLHVLIAAPGFTASEIRKYALIADGSQQGETPRDEKKMMSAEECARHIYRAVKRRQRKIVLTFFQGKATVLVAKLWADLVDGFIYR